MNKKVILLINGEIGSGKTTLCRNLVNYYGEHKAKELAFADKLKQIAHELYQIPKEWLWGTQEDKGKKTHLFRLIPQFNAKLGKEETVVEYYTVREVICLLADYLKLFDPHCFCRPIFSFINSCQVSPGNCQGAHKNLDYFFLSDFRYPFEYTFLAERLPNVEIRTIKLLKQGETNNHNSENSLKGFEFDYVVNNRNYTAEETFNTVRMFIEDIQK